jgi:putative heme iron utilization protein
MTSDATPAVDGSGRAGLAAEARNLVRAATTATLATVDCDDGTPYASLVAVATLHDGRPVLLLSRLALHTRNLLADPRASLLVDRRTAGDDALANPRVTLLGRLAATQEPAARARFLARHANAGGYADFADFGFYALAVARGHLVAGFGRITPLQANEMIEEVADAQELLVAEEDILLHMNDDHADAVALMARVLGGAEAGQWRLVGVDPAGFDLVSGNRGVRLAFPERVRTPDEVRRAFIALVAEARRGEPPKS